MEDEGDKDLVVVSSSMEEISCDVEICFAFSFILLSKTVINVFKRLWELLSFQILCILCKKKYNGLILVRKTEYVTLFYELSYIIRYFWREIHVYDFLNCVFSYVFFISETVKFLMNFIIPVTYSQIFEK